MRPAAVIFDLDDTLLDTSELLEARDRRDWGAVYGRLETVRVFDVADGEPAVTTLPEEVRALGCQVGLYTHSPQRYAQELLRAHAVRIDEMVTGSDRFPSKPDPAGLVAVARRLGVEPADCVYVGDSVGDFGAAAAAGMPSIGVSWTRRTPESWRHGWPDVAVDRPSRLVELVAGAEGLGPVGEEVAAGRAPLWHWGSVMRLGNALYGLGRYFSTADRRHGSHPLSRLILDAKGEGSRLEPVFSAIAEHTNNPPALVVSVPPSPEDEHDRFETPRRALAGAYGARDGVGVLQMCRAVAGYKQLGRAERPAQNVDRFEATVGLAGESAMLIDDVVTSGGQADACRAALRDAGSGAVSVLVAGVAQDSALQDPCPRCGEESGGTVRTRRRRRDGKQFLGCSRYPRCDWTADLPS
jgi:HAD superfamily hydrolase (TIGR01549 family)